METYRIYTKWLALALRRKGFKIIKTDVNENHPQFDVYIFENSPILQENIRILTNEKRK